MGGPGLSRSNEGELLDRIDGIKIQAKGSALQVSKVGIRFIGNSGAGLTGC